MKIGIYFEGSPKMGGGFFQSLKSSLMLLKINEYRHNIEIILTEIISLFLRRFSSFLSICLLLVSSNKKILLL